MPLLASPAPSSGEFATAQWQALGTTVVLRVTHATALAAARRLVESELDAIDRACSRFRPDSELERVNASAGRFVTASPLFLEALDAGLRAAWLTGGAVDPTLGEAIVLAGYSRDFAELAHPQDVTAANAGETYGQDGRSTSAPCRPTVCARRASGWKLIEITRDPPMVRIPVGVRLDLGATAKALAADRAAAVVHEATGAGVLVSLGGDISIAGSSSEGGWAIHVTDDHRDGPHAPGQTITITSGGLATSSTTARRWLRDGRAMHHILDPSTGEPVHSGWRTATVAASNCVDANIASTAALTRGDSALEWLSAAKLPARLVDVAGRVSVLSGWPEDRRGAER